MRRFTIVLFLFFLVNLLSSVQNWKGLSLKQINYRLAQQIVRANFEEVSIWAMLEKDKIELNFVCHIKPRPKIRNDDECFKIYEFAIKSVGEILTQVEWIQQTNYLLFVEIYLNNSGEERRDLEKLNAIDCISALDIIKEGKNKIKATKNKYEKFLAENYYRQELEEWIDKHIKSLK